MTEINPYTPPQPAATDSATATTEDFIAGVRAVEVNHGWEWIVSGFKLFRKQPGSWILVIVIWLACYLVLAIVPLIGGLANMVLYPVFTGGIMLGCRALDGGDGLRIEHLFAGFKQNTSNLVVVGALGLMALIVICVPGILIVGGTGFWGLMSRDPAVMAGIGSTFALAILVFLALSVPVYMALWFAPALIVFRNLAPIEALKISFAGCLKNIFAFLLYGIILFGLSFIAAIPFGLGFIILAPVIMASIYAAFRDIFPVADPVKSVSVP